MTRRDKATPLAFEGVANCKFGVSSVAVFGEVWGALGHTAERGHHAIPEPPAQSHSLWTAATSARPWSLSPVTVDVRLVPGTLLFL